VRLALAFRPCATQGNIRVFARVRPPKKGDTPSVSVERDEIVSVGVDGPSRRSFRFDRAFGSASTQAEVFSEVEPIVTSVLDGYHACVFAYGQTASGKTWTMEGGGAAEERGLVPRTVGALFALAAQRAGCEVTVDVSMLEARPHAHAEIIF
jgi:hypothetical protein